MTTTQTGRTEPQMHTDIRDDKEWNEVLEGAVGHESSTRLYLADALIVDHAQRVAQTAALRRQVEDRDERIKWLEEAVRRLSAIVLQANPLRLRMQR